MLKLMEVSHLHLVKKIPQRNGNCPKQTIGDNVVDVPEEKICPQPISGSSPEISAPLLLLTNAVAPKKKAFVLCNQSGHQLACGFNLDVSMNQILGVGRSGANLLESCISSCLP